MGLGRNYGRAAMTPVTASPREEAMCIWDSRIQRKCADACCPALTVYSRHAWDFEKTTHARRPCVATSITTISTRIHHTISATHMHQIPALSSEVRSHDFRHPECACNKDTEHQNAYGTSIKCSPTLGVQVSNSVEYLPDDGSSVLLSVVALLGHPARSQHKMINKANREGS